MEDSYTLREVAELLGISKRTLQRRIQEGAFPGRYLAPGPEGLQMRIPAADVERARAELHRAGEGHPTRTLVPGSVKDSLLPYRSSEVEAISSAPMYRESLERADVEELRGVVLNVVREEREMFLTAVRDALIVRDREISELRGELAEMRSAVERMNDGLERFERRLELEWRSQAERPAAWTEILGVPANGGGVDVDLLLREIGELEAMVGHLVPE